METALSELKKSVKSCIAPWKHIHSMMLSDIWVTANITSLSEEEINILLDCQITISVTSGQCSWQQKKSRTRQELLTTIASPVTRTG
jgi:hypothetical protein